MTERRKKTPRAIENTWFWKYIVDNKFAQILILTFLTLLTLFIFTQISHVFAPVRAMFSIIGPPIIFAGLFYYLLQPMVDFVEKKGVFRKGAIWIVFGVILLVIALAITFIIPGIRNQFNELVDEFPRIWNAVVLQIESLLNDEWLTEVYQEFQATDIMSRLTEQISNVFTVTLGSISNVAGLLTRIIVTLFTIPFVLYYLLADSIRFKNSILAVTPTRVRPMMQKFMTQASEQVGSYVRGQLLVAVAVAVIFYIGYTIIDLEYALILSILAGILNMVPYLGSIIAAGPALIIGAFVSPFQLLQVIIVLSVEQLIEGRIVSPLILGNELDIHPIVILFIMLGSGSIFGFMGLILAIPGFAVIRVIWNIFFDWLKENSKLYEEEVENIELSEE